MELGTIVLIAILLACPLMMLLMHRGGHKRGDETEASASLEELRRRRDELDAEIASREEDEGTGGRSHDADLSAGSPR